MSQEVASSSNPAPAPASLSLWESFQIQRRVINALVLREMITRFGRQNIGILWLFIEPMMFTLVIATIWSQVRMREDRYGIPIYAFALTGYSAVLLWRNMPSHCIGALKSNAALFYHRNVKAMDVYAARLIIEAAGATASFFVLTVVFMWVGVIQFPDDVSKVIIGWVMLAWFGVSLALCIAPWSEKSEIIVRIWRPISYILFPLSGAIFMVAALPPRAQEIILLLPMVHGVECIRDGFFGNTVKTIYDLNYMGAVNLCMMILGLAFTRVVTRSTDLSG